MMRFIIFLLLFCAPLPAQELLIKADRIFRDGRLEEKVEILCRDGRIVEMGKNLEAPEGVKVIEGDCALPGLIDAHVRLDDGFLVTPVHHFLAHGVTTVRDFNNSSLRVRGLREIIDAGDIAGPRIVFSGESITSRDGVAPFQVMAKTPEEAVDVVKKLKKEGVDFIALGPGTTEEVARAAVEAAGDLPVAADLLGSGALDAGQAVRLGISSLERMSGVAQAVASRPVVHDQEEMSRLFDWLNRDEAREKALIESIVERGVYLVPMLAAFEQIPLPDRLVLVQGNLPPSALDYWKDVRRSHQDFPWWPAAGLLHFNLSRDFLLRAVESGARIAAGSGTPSPGVAPGAGLVRELELYVESGIKPSTALESATCSAAECLGLADELGSLEPGKRADIIVIKGNPLRNISAIRDIVWVVRGGKALKRDEIPGFER